MNESAYADWSKHILQEISRLNDKQETFSEKISENSKILALNTLQLELHIEGVKLAREQNELLRQDIENRITPLELKAARIDGALKLVATVALLVGIYAGLIKIFS